MVASGYIAFAMILPFLFGTTTAAFEEIIPIPQQDDGYDSRIGDSEMRYIRYPDHYLNSPPALWWFNLGECPRAPDGGKRYYCASLTPAKDTVCIDDHQLCDGEKNCPTAEDENTRFCLFYRILKSNLAGLERDVQTLIHRSKIGPPPRRYSPQGITHQ